MGVEISLQFSSTPFSLFKCCWCASTISEFFTRSFNSAFNSLPDHGSTKSETERPS